MDEREAGNTFAIIGDQLRKSLKDQALYLAKQAQENGLDGIVASPQEAKGIRWACGEKFLIVTPGIRLPADPLAGGGIPRDDQQRTASPSEAIGAGADYLVVGRPILEAADPAGAAREILNGIAGH